MNQQFSHFNNRILDLLIPFFLMITSDANKTRIADLILKLIEYILVSKDKGQTQ